MDNWNNPNGFDGFNQNNQENSWDNNTPDTNDNDILDDIFDEGNSSEDNSSEEHPQVEESSIPETEEKDTDSVVEDTGTEDTDVDEDEDEDEGNFSDSIHGKFIKTPANAKSAPTFSEKQIYKIINLVTVFTASNESENNNAGTLFGIRGTDIRKAINLAESETSDINDRVAVVKTLEQIRQSSTGEGIDDPMDFAIALFGRIEGLTDEQKSTMISIVKSYQESTGAKRVRINRNSATAEIIKEIKDAMTGENNIADLVRETGVFVESIEKAVQ